MTIQPVEQPATGQDSRQETPAAAPRKKLVLIDGNAMIHRAFHAVPGHLTNSKGEPVNATFGFTSMLMKALLEEKPDYIAMTFDRPTPTFRHQQFAPYKAQRPPLPDTMRPQFGRIRELVQAFNIPIYEKDGFEADDVLGTLSVQAAQQGVDTVILTGDMDTLQLVNEHVRVKIAKRGISDITDYGISEVRERYAPPPEKLPDYKGLVGDTSDNIPGVAGIGPKTATKLLVEYGDLEGVLAHVDELSPKEQRLLREQSAQALQSKHLATIVCDVPVQLDLQASRAGQVRREQAVALFRELEFRTLVDKIPGGATGESTPTPAVERSKPEPVVAQDETLVEAAPLGMVSILTPPAPPAATIISLPSAQADATQNGAEQSQAATGVITAEQDELVQPSLFETVESAPAR